jgi:hypothetical protein
MSRSPEERTQIPRWIVTFSDMTTNLLTFFVLLLSLGQVRDDSPFDEGNRLSHYFLQSVKAGFGFRDAAQFEYESIRHAVKEPELPQGVTRDAREQRTRRLFATLRRSMETRPSQLTAQGVSFSLANVTFAPGETTLDPAGRQWLSRFAADVQQSLDPATTLLYVVAVTGPETADAVRATGSGAPMHASPLLAARRSWAVADYLRRCLSGPTRVRTSEAENDLNTAWRVFWWGAGPGADWAGQDRLPAGQSQILIAIRRQSD